LLPVAEFSHGFTNLSPEQIRSHIDERIDEIVGALLTAPKVRETGAKHTETFSFQGVDQLECWEKMNQSFLDRGWGDGFPIVAAQPAKVEMMLKGTKRDPREVITILGPGNGVATVQKLAVNAVMAGCLPEHLPVLIAAVEAIAAPRFNLTTVAVSTGPHTPFLIVNGPIARKLNINSGCGALGPGRQSAANIVIGRALRLTMMNVGFAYVGELDMDTIGTPNKFSMVVAENEEKNPWEPYHVEHGFGKDTSTVTAFPCESQMEVNDLRSFKAKHVMNSIVSVVANAGASSSNAWLHGNRPWHNLVVFAPDHASILAAENWTKKDARDYIFHHARVPWLYMKYGGLAGPERVQPGWSWLWDAPEDTPVPVAGGPDWFHVMVVGATAGKTAYFTGVGEPVTKEIKP